MYLMRITKAGRTIEYEKYYTYRYNRKGGNRKRRVRPMTEAQRKANNRAAERKLRLLVNANFGEGDLHVVLSYSRGKGDPHRTREQMKDDIAKFLRRLRAAYRKEGKELRYIHVAEVGEKGARHHHLIMNHIDSRTVQKCWGKLGRVMISPLDDSGQYRKLSDYLVKYSNRTVGTDDAVQAKRWNCSRNLVRPEEVCTPVTNRDFFRSEAKVPPGLRGRYYVDLETVEKGVTGEEFGGFGFFRFTLVAYPGVEIGPGAVPGERKGKLAKAEKGNKSGSGQASGNGRLRGVPGRRKHEKKDGT